MSARRNNQSTPLTIKKSKVAMISEIEIVFNRTKASHLFLCKQNNDEMSQADMQEREQTLINDHSLDNAFGQGHLSHTRTT